jgi:hypothetical protein
VAGVEITIEQINYTATTDKNGYYTISKIPVSTYDLTASWSGSNVTKYTIHVTANQIATVDFDVGMLLPGMGYVVGTVSDKKSGMPVKGAIVRINGDEATTDLRGRYEIMVPNTPYYSNYHIKTSAQDYETSAVYDTGPVGCNEKIKMDFVLTPIAEEEEGVPGFKAIYAIAGLLTVAYLVKRRG